ncbi:V-type ATP synthase subunit D [Candidatus Methanomassiliicoccus intestinalis]|jgi:V-type ATPase, D subunit|uniref:A-type ATP synthase subunit D n=2 Tax=Candidatus Methanomassiliicoccus intestinalis TaxID=1406512 RepID=R9T3X9_METII|nr:V-type ATP synthase subunit D [Candidatus Methanomassiliicoccus intestinalis]AGN25430.1 V-type ATP synthase subunit D [Candidatus Methanomassiliicoccus intestinalis Issoire-Mx1]TQS81752.1 MAG: V-type ATP synthase subunit D [Candidatus Methanomassiliicoccus intestinalis]TQS84306.1 MAG: V-type ATP synthase subunit D [Candidatus Methanomassiliicoccus intestinalis]
MATTEVKPTRSELLEVKRKIKLTQSGYKILKMKRDGLILEFFKILEEAKQAREEASKQHEVAMRKINVAMAVDGIISVKSAAYAHKTHPEISVRSKNVMGLVVPEIEANSVKSTIEERGYGIVGTSTYINEATEAFEELVETLTKAAEIETTLKKLLNEIEGTKRRVNALEFKVIPELQEAEAFIELRLEEMERDNLFSLKHLKGKAEAQE